MKNGDFVEPRPHGNTHIALHDAGQHWWQTACGKYWHKEQLMPSDGDRPRQCQTCWDAM